MIYICLHNLFVKDNVAVILKYVKVRKKCDQIIEKRIFVVAELIRGIIKVITIYNKISCDIINCEQIVANNFFPLDLPICAFDGCNFDFNVIIVS